MITRILAALMLALASIVSFDEGLALAQSTIPQGVPQAESDLNSIVVRNIAQAAASDINNIIAGHPATSTASCPASPVLFEDCLVLGPPITWFKWNGGWQIIGTFNPLGSAFSATGAVAVAPVGGLALYVAPSATGSGNCLSSDNACSLPTACNFVHQIATFLGPGGPINLANGTYSTIDPGTLSLCPTVGDGGGNNQLVSIIGNCASPSSVVLAVPNNDIGLYIKDGGEASIGCVEFTLGTNSTGIQNAGQSSVADYGNVIWGTSGSGSAHVSGSGGSYTNMLSGGETVSANFNIHWLFSGDAQFNGGGATTITATSFTDFLVATGNPYINLSGWTWTAPSLTGVRAVLTGPGYMITAAAAPCATALPGTTSGNCSFGWGFQDNAGDGMTGTGILAGQQAPTINNPVIEANLFSTCVASAGQICHIVDGNAVNCSDGACTTPGATVTLGGGSLDLIIAYDTAWRIFKAQAVPTISNLAGTATNAQIPAPTTSALGGIKAASAATANQFVTYVDTAGAQHTAQPSFSNISGTCAYAQGCVGSPARSFKSLSAGSLGAISSATYLQLGFKGSITPATSGNVEIKFTGEWFDNSNGDSCSGIVSYGTGTAPNNGAAAGGTTVGIAQRDGVTGGYAPLAIDVYVTGLSPSTTYWIDLQIHSTGGSDSCQVGGVQAVVTEQ